MIHAVRFVLENSMTLGILSFLLIIVPILGIAIVNDPD
jgi:predicted PurR-regulated permease PerM